jgi:transposase
MDVYAGLDVRVGLEVGATSEWIGGHLVDEGFPVVCLESRHVKAALGAMTVKTDRNDAQGLAQIVRTGWFKAVHLKSATGERLRWLRNERATVTVARKAAVRAVTANEQVIRGLLRPLGLKMVGTDRLLVAIFEPLLLPHKSLRAAVADVDLLVAGRNFRAANQSFAEAGHQRSHCAAVDSDQLIRQLLLLVGQHPIE